MAISMIYRLWLPTIFLAGFLLSSSPHAAENYQIIDVPDGAARDVYFEINLSGKVYLHLVAEDGGEACADFWWIKWPFGNITSLGRNCGYAAFEIPGITDLAISAKLRVGGANTHLKIVASDSVQVANTVTVLFP